ncbi:SHOCT domain-containing protein [Photobacterium makurazakiensis]|uniref:SHOCT domain-containing protein n=1 Tax=Photobacterium makurazakiensis TaxID=2910234 RepID=UPI003D10B50A
MHGFHEFSWFMPISMALFFGGIIYLAFSGTRPPAAAESALDIAKKRFARGEITADELDEIKQKL